MYHPKTRRLSDDQIEALLTLSAKTDLAPGPGGSRINAPDPALANDLFPWNAFPSFHRLAFVALYPSSQIVAHADPPIHGIRHHIPLQLNPGCWVFHDGTWQQLEVGQDYTMDPTQVHGAVNWGPTLRLHLIVDVEKDG